MTARRSRGSALRSALLDYVLPIFGGALLGVGILVEIVRWWALGHL